jgi:hypothetical protein
MKQLKPKSRRDWLMLVACSAMLTAAAVSMTPGTAHADPKYQCNCTGTYCQDTGGSPFQRWCCNDQGQCGCTLSTNC